ncbi:unnamed protein product [Sphagnum balticum]
MMRVKRQTQRDKQISLLELRQEVYDEIKLNYDLKFGTIQVPILKKEMPFEFTSERAAMVRGYARTISYFICALMMSFILVDHDTEEMSSTFTYGNIFS